MFLQNNLIQFNKSIQHLKIAIDNCENFIKYIFLS